MKNAQLLSHAIPFIRDSVVAYRIEPCDAN